MVNGVRLHYTRSGGGGPPVVLAHGLTDSGACWGRLAGALEGDFDLVLYDARGHGRSAAPERGYRPEDHVVDLLGLLQELGLEKPALIGHSMGAANVALAAAAHPELASCLVLEDPPWQDHYPDDVAAGLEEWQQEIVAAKARSLEEIIGPARAEHPEWAEVEWLPWAEAKRRASPRVFDWVAPGPALDGWREVVSAITCPLLLLTADTALDALVTPEVAGEVVVRCPRAEVVRIAGAGHSIRRERFEPYRRAVSAFLRSRYLGAV